MLSMSFEFFILSSAILSPFLCSVLIFILRKYRYIKEILGTIFSSLLTYLILKVYLLSLTENDFPIILYRLSSNLNIGFKISDIGIVFSLLVSFLWSITNIYTISYMSLNDKNSETKKGTFLLCFSASIGCTICIAFSKNLLTLFIFYELLTLTSYFLVTYNSTPESYNAGKYYLGTLLASSMTFFLSALIITYIINGTLEFEIGGIFDHNTSKTVFNIILIFFSLGIAKTALMPFHFWLPKAMVAPTPVSALLHAVAIVKSGLYALLKIIICTLGMDNIKKLSDFNFLMYMSGFTIIISSLVAIKQTNLKKILAYSTISQLSYVIMIASLATSSALKASLLQLISHSFAKITLFFAVGIIQTCSGRKHIKEIYGIGRLIPLTMGAFTIGAIAIIGLPPTLGFWSKFFIIHSSVHEGSFFIPTIIIISTVLNAIYFVPIIYNSFFRKTKINCMPVTVSMMIPLIITSTCTIILFFMVNHLLNIVNISLY